MQSKAKTVDEYLASLPEDRRKALETLRAVILKNLDKGYEEGMGYGMMGYYVPHSIYPAGYHCDPKQPLPFAGMASQKNHMSLYLMCVYGDEDAHRQFREEWLKAGKKLDMGKACVRFKKIEDVPLDVVGRAIKRVTVKKCIAHYESALLAGNKAAAARAAKKKAAPKKAAPKKAAPKKAAKPASKSLKHKRG